MNRPGTNLGLRVERPAANRPSHDTAWPNGLYIDIVLIYTGY
jgi:hypothetical protein